MRMRARRDDDGYVLDGQKIFITSGEYAGLFVVWAVTDPDAPKGKGISVFLVPADTPGVSVGKAEKKMGQTGSAKEWASLIDHTLLKPEATDDDIRKLCQEAATYRFASVCVNPTWVRAASCNLRGSGIPVCTVIGFPLGATLADLDVPA